MRPQTHLRVARAIGLGIGLGGCLLLAVSAWNVPVSGEHQPTPVLVELFTSEGCSTCPPADAVLEQLDKLQPVAGAQVIALSEHVDYWNHDGWVDPFSSPLFSRRQEAYETRLGVPEPYTPQMVVDGQATFNGSDARQAVAVIRKAAEEPKLRVSIMPAPGGKSVTIQIQPEAQLPASRSADVYTAIAEDSGSSNVLKGENRGHVLRYVSIAKTLRKVGKLSKKSGWRAELSVDAADSGQRLIAFVQENGTGKVLGSAMYRVPK